MKTFTTLLMILAVITALAGVIIGIYFIADDESAIGFGFIAGSLLSFLMLFIKAYTAEVICNISEKLNSTKVEEPRTTTQHNTTQHNTTPNGNYSERGCEGSYPNIHRRNTYRF